MRINININDEIWYYKLLDNNYYGRSISDISELKHGIIKNIYEESTYHNLDLMHYEINNGDKITDLSWYIYTNENVAIQNYNESIYHQISLCDSEIKKLNDIHLELEHKIIKIKAL